MKSPTRIHHVYLLRIWQERPGTALRYSLAMPAKGERHSFATMEALFTHLMQVTGPQQEPVAGVQEAS